MSQFEEMVSVLQRAWPVRDQIVICLEGPVGIGKTAAVEEHRRRISEKYGRSKLITIIASQILPNEVSGITMPVHESKAMEIYDHYRLSSLEDGDILFFDELLEADQLVLSACLTLIESRQMMSGRKLPDIQIIAATNATIKPNMLKENIRQRFVWRKFDIDRDGCRQYIKRKYGFDIGEEIALTIRDTGNDYNIPTQRTITKMAYWMSTAENPEQALEIADTINGIWRNGLGTHLMEAMYADMTPEKQVRTKLVQLLQQRGIVNIEDKMTNELFFDDNVSITELLCVLQKLPEWDEIEDELSRIEIDEMDVGKVTF